jgi:hypothetical protein
MMSARGTRSSGGWAGPAVADWYSYWDDETARTCV